MDHPLDHRLRRILAHALSVYLVALVAAIGYELRHDATSALRLVLYDDLRTLAQRHGFVLRIDGRDA